MKDPERPQKARKDPEEVPKTKGSVKKMVSKLNFQKIFAKESFRRIWQKKFNRTIKINARDSRQYFYGLGYNPTCENSCIDFCSDF